MSVTFTEDDVGKTVENADGEEVGIVAAIERETAHVEPNPGILDSIRAALGWESDTSDTVPLDEDAVREVTDDVVRLEGDLSVQGETVGTGARTEHEPNRDRDVEREPAMDPAEGMDGPDEMGGTDEMRGADEMGGTDEMGAAEDVDVTDGTGRPEPTETDETSIDEESGRMGERPPTDDVDRDVEVDPSDVTEHDPDPEAEVRPDEDVGERTDAETDPGEGERRTDQDEDDVR